jgi:ribosomal protein S27E
VYSVVGCPDCGALKIVEDRPDTTSCPRCGRRSAFDTLRQFYRGGDAETAREVRSRLLAERSGNDPEAAGYIDRADRAADAGMDDDEYLERAGLDAEEVAAAGERADSAGGSNSRSRREIVLDALREHDRPTAGEVRAYAAEQGVDPEYAEEALARLRRAGEVSESGGRYRLL